MSRKMRSIEKDARMLLDIAKDCNHAEVIGAIPEIESLLSDIGLGKQSEEEFKARLDQLERIVVPHIQLNPRDMEWIQYGTAEA